MKFWVCLLFLIPMVAHAARTIDFGPSLCDAGFMQVDGTCTENTRGKCSDGYYQIVAEMATFSGVNTSGQCAGAYSPATFSDWFYVMYSGTLVPFGANLCGPGQHMVNDTCVTQQRGECPSNFYQITTINETFTTTNMGACNDGYTAANLTTNCANGVTAGGVCSVLCDAGLKYTGVGTCAMPCAAGITTLKTSTGQAWPLYASRQTTPSVVVQTGTGICYANLVPGTGTGTINVRISDTDAYHVTD